MRFLAIAACFLASVAASPAMAQQFGRHGDWVIMASGDVCQLLTMSDDKQTIATIKLTTKGRMGVEATSAGWDIGQGEAIDIKYVFAGSGDRNFDGSRGYLSRDGWSGYSATIGDANRAGFIRDMSAGSKLTITANGRQLTTLSLKGSSSGLAALQRCAGQIILGSARLPQPYMQARLATFNREIHLDALNRWRFYRYDPESVWTAEATGLNKDGYELFRVHYTFNNGVPGYVDVKEKGGRRWYCYWDRPKLCVPARN